MLFEKKIRFNDKDDMQAFVQAAGNCDFDIDVISGNIFIDAKSILGVIGLGFERELVVKYGHKNKHFESVLENLVCA